MAEVDDWISPPAAAAAPADDWISPPQSAQAAAPQEIPDDDWVTPPPEPESMFATAGRAFLHEAPAVVAGAAGAMYGAGVGSLAGPWGTVGGALTGAVAGGYGGAAAAGEAKKFFGLDDDVQVAVNAKANPWSAAIGQGAAQILGFGAGTASTAARLAGAGIGAGIEGGMQAYQGEFDPAKLAVQGAAGAVFTNPYKWGERAQQAGAKAGEQLHAAGTRTAERINPPEYGPHQPYGPPEMQGPPAPPDYHGASAPKSSAGVSETPTPPRQDTEIGLSPDNKPIEGERTGYAKDVRPKLDDGSSTVHVGDTDPDIAHVFESRAKADTPPPPEPPTEYGQRLDQEFPRVGAQEGFTPQQMGAAPPPPAAPVAEAPQGPTRQPAKKGANTDNMDVLEYLASQGGIRLDNNGELAALLDGRNPSIPRFGSLVRKGGMTLDDALRKITADAPYLHDEGARTGGQNTTSTNDLLDILERALRGEKIYQMGMEPPAAQKLAAGRVSDENLNNIYYQVDDLIENYGANPAFREPMVKLMVKEGIDAETAHDRVMEGPQPTYEAGAEGKPQAVIPGAEQIGQGELAQRASDRGMQAKVPQKGPNEGFMERLPDELFAERKVTERGRSGRPIKTEPLPIGNEEGVIEAGLRKVQETPRPDVDAPRTTEAMARMTREELEALTAGKPVTKGEPSKRLSGKKLTQEGLAQAEGASPISGAAQPKTTAKSEALKLSDTPTQSTRIDMSEAEREALRPKPSNAPPVIPEHIAKQGFEIGQTKDGKWVLTQDSIYRGEADNAAQLVKQASGMPKNKPDWKETIPYTPTKTPEGATDFDAALAKPRKADEIAAAREKASAASVRDTFTNNSNKKKFDQLLGEESETGDLVRGLVAKHDEASKKILDAGYLPKDHARFIGNPELVQASNDRALIAGGLNRFLNGVARKNTPERRASDLETIRADLAEVSRPWSERVKPKESYYEGLVKRTQDRVGMTKAEKAAANAEPVGPAGAEPVATAEPKPSAPAPDPVQAASDKILADLGITPTATGGKRDAPIIGENEFDKAAIAGEKIKVKGRPTAAEAIRTQGEYRIEPDHAKPGEWVVKKGDEVISEHKLLGPAYIALNKAAKGAPGTPAALSPTGGQATPPANVGAATRQGGGGGGAPAGGGPSPPPQPPGPPQPNMAHTPPPQRGWFHELLRDVQRKVGAHLLGPEGMDARRLIRGAYGENYRVAEQTAHMLKNHQETIRAMNPADRAAMINQMQGGNRFPNFQPTPEQRAFMRDHERTMQEWEGKLHTLPDDLKIQFLDNYMAQMYKNPTHAPNVFAGAGKRGGAGSTKHRKYLDYEEAKDAGLIPHSDDPIEISTRYINSIKDFVAAKQVLERGEFSGSIAYFKSPQAVGATGGPEPLVKGGPPPGWKKLDTPGKGGKDAYAPEDFADTYNNFYNKGFGQTDKSRNVYEAVRNSTNAWTQLELGVNAYHMFTMANEAIISDVGGALNKLFQGDIKGAGRSLAHAPMAPRARYLEGKIFQKEYLDPNSTNPIATILAEANARPIGRGHAADYTFQDRGSFINKFDRHSIQSELQQAGREISADFNKAFGPGGTDSKVLFPLRQAGRALQTVAAPIFDKYIPALKAGAVHGQMKDWHEAMVKKNPAFDMVNNPADRRVAVNAAMKIVDSVDNRFGEMIHDNMFMNATLKQSAQVAMRSFSWAIGAMKEIGGGTLATGKALTKLATSRGAENRFDMTHADWDPRMSYAIAFPFVLATISSVYQMLRAGEKPEGWRDLYAPKTGGTVPGVGGRGQVKEHVLMPGYQKDVMGWTHHPLQEMYNKLGGLPQTAIEQLSGKDWKGAPIVRHNASLPEVASDRMAHIFSKLGPISVKNMVKGTEPTSNITGFETALGFRAPGAFIQDPEGLKRAMDYKSKKEWRTKEKRERKIELRQSGG